jgi:hypothetical protein
MKVIPNFELKSNLVVNPSFDPWLQDIFNEIEKQSNAGFNLRVDVEKLGRTSFYTIDNRKNKTHAIVSRTRGKIRVDIFERKLPDIFHYIKPPINTISSIVVENDTEGKEKAANRIVNTLAELNDYSNNTVIKIKVTNDGQADKTKNLLVGGLIIELLNEENKTFVTIENGESFEVPRKEAEEKRIGVLKYIVFDDVLNFDVLEESEFPHYFELA